MNPTHRYRTVLTESASKEDLVVLSYEALLRFEGEAREAFARGDVAEGRRLLAKARAIIGELLAALDPEPAPELVGNLDRLYRWMTVELAEAGFHKDERRIAPVMRVTERLLDGFHRAFRNAA